MPANAKRRARRMKAGITRRATIHGAPTISTLGSDTAINWEFRSRGTGRMTWNGIPVLMNSHIPSDLAIATSNDVSWLDILRKKIADLAEEVKSSGSS